MAEREELILEVTAQLDEAKSNVAELQAELEKLVEPTELTVTAGVEGQEEVDALAATTDELDGSEATVLLDAEDGASDAIDDVSGAVGDLDGAEAEVTLEADDEATDAVEEVADAVDDLDGQTAEVTVEADTADATSGLQDMNAELGSLIGAGGGAAKALGLGAGGLGGVLTALGGLGTKAFQFTGDVEELSLFTGDALEESSKLLAVLQDYTKIDVSQLEGIIARLVQSLDRAPELAERLGINLANVRGPIDTLVQVFDALDNEAIDASDRMMIAMQLFGRGGIKAVNEIRASIKGDLADAIAEVSEARIVDAADLEAADRLEESMGQLNGALNDMAQTLGEQIIPQLALMAEVGAPAVDALTEGLANQLGIFTKFINDTKFLWNQVFGDEGITFDEFGGGEFEETVEHVASALEDMNTALVTNRTAVSDTDIQWRNLVDDLRDGVIDTNAGQYAWNRLRQTLQLTDEQMAKLAQQKLSEQLKADEQTARDLADAMVDVAGRFHDAASEIEGIRLTRFDELGSGLQSALDMSDVSVDFQSVKQDLSDAFTELQEFVDENGEIDWASLLRTDVDVANFNSEVAGLVTQVRDQFQSGIVEAFDLGGAGAAQHFVDSFMPQLLALGMTPEQAYELLGLPADGSVQALIQPIVEQQAADRARAILDAIAGAGIQDPRIAAIQILLERDQIEPELAEVVALILAQEVGIPVSLDSLAPEDVAAAQAYLDNNPLTVPIGGDVTEAQAEVEGFRSDQENEPVTLTGQPELGVADRAYNAFTIKKRVADIEANPTNIAPSDKALNSVAKPGGRPRTAPINANVLLALIMEALLNHVARPRDAPITANLFNAGGVEAALNAISRDRFADIFVRLHQSLSGNPAGLAGAPVGAAAGVGPLGGPGPLGASSPSSTSSITTATGGQVVENHFHSTINAGVVGNRSQVERWLRDANRRNSRFVGSRQLARSKL